MPDKQQSHVSSSDPLHLRKLLSTACDSGLDEATRRKLESILGGSEAAREEYIDFVALEALLEQRSARTQLTHSDSQLAGNTGYDTLSAHNVKIVKGKVDEEATQSAEKRHAEKGTSNASSRGPHSVRSRDTNPNPTDRPPRSSWTTRRAVDRLKTSWAHAGLAMAASLFLLAGIWFFRNGSHASIVAVEDATWANGAAYGIGDSVGDNWIELEQGAVKLAFHSKALVLIRGPARFRAVSSDESQLELGSVTAHVPNEAHGFKVRAPDLTVIDLGTGFELNVTDDGVSRIHVMEGRVRVESDNDSAELTAGQLATYDARASDQANLMVEESSLLEPRTSGSISYNPEHPESLGYRAYVDDAKVNLFLENAYHRLPVDVRVHHTRPGNYKSLELPRATLPAGTHVHSYLLHYSPESGRKIVRGSATFPGRILGIIGDTDMLNATNPVLGSSWTLQCRHAERGIESTPDPNSDIVTLSADMRTLTVSMRTESIDQMRVLVECIP